MKPIYTTYKCKNSQCRKENILITEEVENTLKQGKYISCSHCGSRNLENESATSDLRECMNHSAYKKINGAIRQVRNK